MRSFAPLCILLDIQKMYESLNFYLKYHCVRIGL